MTFSGWDYKWLASGEPVRYLEPRPYIEQNTILRYWITTYYIFLVGLIQWAVRKGIRTWYPTDILQFTFLLPVANISIVMLNVNGPQHGYYIHGKTTNEGGMTEGTAEDLKRYLEQEENNGTRKLY